MKQDSRQIEAYRLAREMDGLKEIPGASHNPKIVQMFADCGHEWVKDDETAWCAAFVGSMLKRAGLEGTGALNARSYLKWGDHVADADAQPGDIVVFWRGDPNGWQGHVGFLQALGASTVQVLGGNQGNQVSVAGYSRERLLGIRRISDTTGSSRPAKNNLLTLIIDLLKGWFNVGKT